MIRGLFSLLFRLVFLAILVVLLTAVWIVYDGLNDRGDHADCAVVLGTGVLRDGSPGPVLRARLDRAVELYDKGEFPLVIVSGATKLGGYDEPAAMSNYLIEHQVPSTAVVQDKGGANTDDSGYDVARITKQRGLHSVMVVSNYYHITRAKLALYHAGVTDIEQAHVGVVTKDDIPMVAREVVALYYYIGRFYLTPAAEKAKEQAAVESQKIEESAQKMRDKANQELENMHK